MAAKIIIYDNEARKSIEAGVNSYRCSESTLGPKGRNVKMEKIWNLIYKRWSYHCKGDELKDPYENMEPSL